MASGMVERVARAIYDGRNGSGATPWATQRQAHKAPYLNDARAAITAMREPTEEMRRAGSQECEGDIAVSGLPPQSRYRAPLPTQ